MTPEERKRRARDRNRRKRGWTEQDFPVTKLGLYTPIIPNLLPGAMSGPCVDTRLVPPDRKPRRKSEPKTKPDAGAQPTMDFTKK